ncbi:hypothetical protein C5C03_00460 [Clavibacter michiganensis]|nr:hypothetical protein C5C03_00460 [Clavibacter michiganensis]PPF99372.1 hypothetical protein C5C05_02260 [Clavibacter michiganensis]
MGILLLTVALASCSSTGQSAPQDVTTAPPAVAGSMSPAPVDTASPDSQREAVGVAEAAMKEFVARDRPYDVWWAALSPYLGTDGTYAFEYTDPQNVPASEVTGAGEVSAAPSGTSVTVLVPTDIGQYQVALDRRVEDGTAPGPWLVDDITPPGTN